MRDRWRRARTPRAVEGMKREASRLAMSGSTATEIALIHCIVRSLEEIRGLSSGELEDFSGRLVQLIREASAEDEISVIESFVCEANYERGRGDYKSRVL